MPAPAPNPGDYIDTYDDEGTVLAVKGGWVYFHSERMGKTAKRLESSVTVCPPPEGITELCREVQSWWTEGEEYSRAGRPPREVGPLDYSRLEIAQPTGRKPSNR